jgi:sugar phosphate isomerase/epimerase
MATIPIALQLYTVREEMARDFAGTLRRVAEIGYEAVELAGFLGFGGLSVAEVRGLLDETGLRAASIHVGLDRLQSDLRAAIDECRGLGSAYLVLPWLPPGQRDAAFFDALAPQLNEIGGRCREHGLVFAYHNHDFEFVQSDGAYLLDRLLDATDPTLVALELDVYWAAYAGVDPASYLRQRAGRVPLVHLKDMAADRSFAEVGDGTLDFAAIFAAAEEGDTRWYIVEHDQPAMPALESARRSLQNLRAMGK